jgi:glutathionyl-hydroquinone reductase
MKILKFEYIEQKGMPLFNAENSTHRVLALTYMDNFIYLSPDEAYHKAQFMHTIYKDIHRNLGYFVDGVSDGIYRAGFAGYVSNYEGFAYSKIFNVHESLSFVEVIDYK